MYKNTYSYPDGDAVTLSCELRHSDWTTPNIPLGLIQVIIDPSFVPVADEIGPDNKCYVDVHYSVDMVTNMGTIQVNNRQAVAHSAHEIMGRQKDVARMLQTISR